LTEGKEKNWPDQTWTKYKVYFFIKLACPDGIILEVLLYNQKHINSVSLIIIAYRECIF
jgi:hypothetical protein